MMPLLAALLLSHDPYQGFSASYLPFGTSTLYPWDVKTLKEKGYDMTSLLYDRREQIATILGFATAAAKFDPRRVNLIVRLGRKTWTVDYLGTVMTDGRSARLSKAEMAQLNTVIRLALPSLPPEEP